MNSSEQLKPTLPEQESIMYRRTDGTIEHAENAADAISRCPVLGRLAIEAPEEMDMLLELAAKGQEVMSKRAEIAEPTIKSQTPINKLHEAQPDATNRLGRTRVVPAVEEAKLIMPAPQLANVDNEIEYILNEINNDRKDVTILKDTQPKDELYNEHTVAVEASYQSEKYLATKKVSAQPANETATVLELQEKKLDTPPKAKITIYKQEENFTVIPVEPYESPTQARIETPRHHSQITDTHTELFLETHSIEVDPLLSESEQESAYQPVESVPPVPVIDELMSEEVLGEDIVKPLDKIKALTGEVSAVFRDNIEDEEHIDITTELLELQGLIEHDGEQYDEEHTIHQLEKIISKLVMVTEPIDIRHSLLAMTKDEVKELIADLLDEITSPIETDGREILALDDGSLDITALDARHKLAKLIFGLIIRVGSPTQSSLLLNSLA